MTASDFKDKFLFIFFFCRHSDNIQMQKDNNYYYCALDIIRIIY